MLYLNVKVVITVNVQAECYTCPHPIQPYIHTPLYGSYMQKGNIVASYNNHTLVDSLNVQAGDREVTVSCELVVYIVQ